MVSGLCLDSQTPTGPLVIMQCRPQVASQSWEPQIITWATVDGGRGSVGWGEQILDPACRTQGIVCTLSPRWGDERSENCTSVMSTSSSCSLCDESVAEDIWTALRSKKRSFVYSASSLEDAAVLLRNLCFSLKTVSHLTFYFCIYPGHSFA